MSKQASKKVARALLRRNLDEPTRAERYLALYLVIDRAQLCADPIVRLKEAREHIDALITSYTKAVRR